jgi:hypothetical protein
MFRIPSAFAPLPLFAALAAASVPIQEPLAVTVPHFNNVACPIMGKKVSTRLYAETEMGRIYVCCKSCIQDIQADVATAYKSAYPIGQKAENSICPVSGEPITQESPIILLQGREISLSSLDHAVQARANSQAILARLADPALVDLGNATCPVAGTAVAADTFVLIGKTMVRVSSLKQLDAIKKDPAGILKKAQEIRATELAKAAEAKAKESTQ